MIRGAVIVEYCVRLRAFACLLFCVVFLFSQISSVKVANSNLVCFVLLLVAGTDSVP